MRLTKNPNKSLRDLLVCRLVYGLLSQEKSSSEVGEVVVCVKRGFAPAAGSRPDRQGGCAGDVPQVRGLAVSRKCGPRQAVRRLRDAASTCRTAAEDSRPRGTTMYLTSVQRCADLNRGFSLANAPTTRRQTRAPLFPRTWIWSRVCTPCQDFSCWGTGHGADVARARSSRGRFARPEGSIVSPGPSIAPPRPVSTLNRTDPPAGR